MKPPDCKGRAQSTRNGRSTQLRLGKASVKSCGGFARTHHSNSSHPIMRLTNTSFCWLVVKGVQDQSNLKPAPDGCGNHSQTRQ